MAQSAFASEHVQNKPLSDHSWKLRCRKSARRCGAKQISKSKCTKHTSSGPLLEVEMSKKCTPLWREAHFEVKMHKTHQLRTTDHFWRFRCRKSATACTFSTSEPPKVVRFRSQNAKNTRGSDHFWRFRCRFVWQAQRILHLVKSEQRVGGLKHFQRQPPLHHTTLQYITLQLQLHLHYILLHYTPRHYTALNYTQLHYITLHYTTLHSTTLHYITLHYTTFHDTSLHYITLHSTTLQLQLRNYTPISKRTLLIN